MFLLYLQPPHPPIMDIQLDSSDAKQPQRDPDCIQMLQSELAVRAASSKPLNPDAALATEIRVAQIQGAGATQDPTTGHGVISDNAPYTLDELDSVLKSIDPTSRSLRLCHSSLKVHSLGARLP